jgi:hypothetical protein
MLSTPKSIAAGLACTALGIEPQGPRSRTGVHRQCNKLWTWPSFTSFSSTQSGVHRSRLLFVDQKVETSVCTSICTFLWGWQGSLNVRPPLTCAHRQRGAHSGIALPETRLTWLQCCVFATKLPRSYRNQRLYRLGCSCGRVYILTAPSVCTCSVHVFLWGCTDSLVQGCTTNCVHPQRVRSVALTCTNRCHLVLTTVPQTVLHGHRSRTQATLSQLEVQHGEHSAYAEKCAANARESLKVLRDVVASWRPDGLGVGKPSHMSHSDNMTECGCETSLDTYTVQGYKMQLR